jgi:hypothetical protein
MTGLKTLVAAVLLSAISATAALAQSEPAAFESQYPNRDILNGGALTPAGRAALEASGGAAGAYRVDDSRGATGSAGPLVPARRYHARRVHRS